MLCGILTIIIIMLHAVASKMPLVVLVLVLVHFEAVRCCHHVHDEARHPLEISDLLYTRSMITLASSILHCSVLLLLLYYYYLTLSPLWLWTTLYQVLCTRLCCTAASLYIANILTMYRDVQQILLGHHVYTCMPTECDSDITLHCCCCCCRQRTRLPPVGLV